MGRWRKLGIIAGGGALPVRVAAACRANNQDFHAIRLSGACNSAPADLPGDECAIGEAGKILGILKANNCDAIVLAGIVKRPDFRSLKVDWRGASMLPKLAAAAMRGDGALLSAVIESIESDGFIIVGVDDVVESLLAPAGAVGAIAPSSADMKDLQKAAGVVDALGPFDVGQGAVVANGLVLAIEAAEGTDAMLLRCVDLPVEAKDRARAGILVKQPKLGQELRIDLPTIGPETVRHASDAGLNGIAVKAGGALIIDRDGVVRLADELKLFVYGYNDKEAGKQ